MTDRPWIDVLQAGAARRLELAQGLTRLGGPQSDFPLSGWTGGELHFWDDPPRVLFSGGGPRPVVNGAEVDEAELTPGDRLEWAHAQIVYHPVGAGPVKESAQEPARAPAQAPAGRAAVLASPANVLEEIPMEPERSATPVAAVVVDPDDPRSRLFAKLWAGLLVEQGLADRGETKRWQDAVLRGEFDADAAARDLLRRGTPDPGDPKVVLRTDRLMRDLLMAPVTQGVRGASRRARGAAQSGTAFVVVQILAILVYTAVVLVAMLLVRVKWDYSFDGLFDSFLGRG